MSTERVAWFTWGDDLLDSGFIAIPNGLMQHQRQLDLSPQEVNVILQVASYYRNSSDMFPSVASIANSIGISPRHVRRINESLIEKGYLELKERWAEGHRRTSNTWNFGGLISKLRSIMSGRGDVDVIDPPDVDVIDPPDSGVRGTILNKEQTKKEPSLSHNPYIADMQKFMGFPENTDVDPIPNHAKEVKFIKKMINRGFDWRKEIFLLWKRKVMEKGQFVSMAWVNEDITRKSGKVNGNVVNPDPDKYIKQKYGHMVER